MIIHCWLFIPQTPGAGGSQRAAEHAGSPFRLRSTSPKWKGPGDGTRPLNRTLPIIKRGPISFLQERYRQSRPLRPGTAGIQRCGDHDQSHPVQLKRATLVYRTSCTTGGSASAVADAPHRVSRKPPEPANILMHRSFHILACLAFKNDVNKTYRSQPHFFCPRAIGRADCGRRWYQRAH